ncbi:MAG: imidazole glycerol phosphate synthase subunit HisH [Muribaculaceae bacterium]
MSVGIIKYNAGNIFSVRCALQRIGVDALVTDDKQELLKCDKIIFPGVGEASTAMAHLRATGLDNLILSLKQPVLGICIGMQLMCDHSEEGDADCLGIFDGLTVKRFDNSLADESFKIPHMGWDTINVAKGNRLLPQDLCDEYVYYVHSYYAPISERYTIASTDYIVPYSAALNKDNFYATQFHPEKSGRIGESILRNFLEL